jgi:hypothetical protein
MPTKTVPVKNNYDLHLLSMVLKSQASFTWPLSSIQHSRSPHHHGYMMVYNIHILLMTLIMASFHELAVSSQSPLFSFLHSICWRRVPYPDSIPRWFHYHLCAYDS